MILSGTQREKRAVIGFPCGRAGNFHSWVQQAVGLERMVQGLFRKCLAQACCCKKGPGSGREAFCWSVEKWQAGNAGTGAGLNGSWG